MVDNEQATGVARAAADEKAPDAATPDTAAALDAAADERALRGVVRGLRRFTPLRRFGWAFLLAWVFCIFYTNVIEGYTGALAETSANLAQRLFLITAPVFCSVVTLVFVVALEERCGSPTQHPALFAAAPLMAAVATLLLFLQLPSTAATMLVFGLGAVLTGIGSGLLWVMWGEYYARITQEEVEFLAPTSAVIAAVLVLIMTAVEGWVAVALVALFPVFSGICLTLSWDDVQKRGSVAEYKVAAEQRAYSRAHEQARSSLPRVLKLLGRDGFGILAACLFICLEGSFWEAPAEGSLAMQAVFVVSIVFMLIVSVSATRGPRRVSLSFLYRWMCPVVVAGFAAIIVAGYELGCYLAFMVAIAARFTFCLITQMYFARYAVQGSATPVQSYGLGWIFVHLGDFLGAVVLVCLEGPLAAGAITLEQLAAVCMALLVAATMFVLNDSRSFHFHVREDAEAEAALPTEGEAPEAGEEARAQEDAEAERADATIEQPAAEALSAAAPQAEAAPQAAVAPQPAPAPQFAAASQPEAAPQAAAAPVGGQLASGERADSLDERIQALSREAKLTPRETEVFDLLARGRSIPYVRDALVISRDTAATHAKHIYAKLGVHSRQELIDLVH